MRRLRASLAQRRQATNRRLHERRVGTPACGAFAGIIGVGARIASTRGERPGLEEYLRRFPADAELVTAAFAVVPTVTLVSPPAPVPSVSGGLLARGQSRWLSGARRLLAKRMWALPLVAAVILAVAGFWAHTTIERVMRAQVASELLALRDADVEALQLLFGAHEALTSVAANNPRVRKSVHDLLARGDGDTAALLRAPEQADLREALTSWLGQYEYDGFRILGRQGRSIASRLDLTVGGHSARRNRMPGDSFRGPADGLSATPLRSAAARYRW